MPGAGKTTLGPKLADELQVPFYDLDAFIEAQEGRPVPEIFNQAGEDGFREIEAAALRNLTKTAGKAVIATGGGTPCFKDNLGFMNAAGLTVYLEATVAELAERLQKQGLEKRPLLAGKTEADLKHFLTGMLQQRQKFYLQATVIARPNRLVAVFLQEILNALTPGS